MNSYKRKVWEQVIKAQQEAYNPFLEPQKPTDGKTKKRKKKKDGGKS